MQGAAIQKIFATLILFHTLLRLDAKQKIFLVEEPESLLYPLLVAKYFRLLYLEARKNKIQMIVTSNSKHVIDCFNNRIVLSAENPSIIHWDTSDSEVIHLTASISSNKPVIFLDGNNDVDFVCQVCPNWINEYQFISSRGRKEICKLFIDEYAKPNKLKVICLRDKEFILPELIEYQVNQEEKEMGVPVVYWKLPCIESYLILHLFLSQDPNEMIGKFKKYANSLIQSTQYFMGVTQGVNKLLENSNQKNIQNNIASHWLSALAEIDQPSPDWRKIVEVIHGHTWLNQYISTERPILTLDLLAFIFKSNNNDLHPVVRSLLNETLDMVNYKIDSYKFK